MWLSVKSRGGSEQEERWLSLGAEVAQSKRRGVSVSRRFGSVLRVEVAQSRRRGG
jgi:hypothetical protein